MSNLAKTIIKKKAEEHLLKSRYTLVFAFDRSYSAVLLIAKNSGTIKGKLNGLGGKILEDETPIQCAKREFLEESGMNIREEHFKEVGVVVGKGFFITVFGVQLNTPVRTNKTKEGYTYLMPLSHFEHSDLSGTFLSDVPVLVHASKLKLRFPQVKQINIIYE